MWRPPERIRFQSASGRVPSREEAVASLLFSPIRVGSLTLEQRSWVPAMVPWRATEEGFVTDEVLELLAGQLFTQIVRAVIYGNNICQPQRL